MATNDNQPRFHEPYGSWSQDDSFVYVIYYLQTTNHYVSIADNCLTFQTTSLVDGRVFYKIIRLYNPVHFNMFMVWNSSNYVLITLVKITRGIWPMLTTDPFYDQFMIRAGRESRGTASLCGLLLSIRRLTNM